MLNRIVLIGRLTRDPESSYTPNGIAVTKFTVAVDRFSKNQETGEKETDFIPVVAFRRSAEFVTQYVTKGRMVSVDGRLQIRTWVAQDGSKKYFTEVIADNVQALDKPRDSDGSAVVHAGEEPEFAGARVGGAPAPIDTADDSDPFADE